jgi:hypothetical protein
MIYGGGKEYSFIYIHNYGKTRNPSEEDLMKFEILWKALSPVDDDN